MNANDSNDFKNFAQDRRTQKSQDKPRTIKLELTENPGRITNRQAIERQYKVRTGR